MRGRSGLKAAAVVAFAAMVACTSAATVSYAVEPGSVIPVTPPTLEDGRYIVLLDEQPAATYEGGEAGLNATKVAEGESLDASTEAVVEYSSYLTERQEEVAAEAGAVTDNNLTITLNAFTANLSATQAQKLAGMPGVVAVVPDEILHPTAVPSPEFLGLTGPDGVWQTYSGGPEGAGEGTVVGVIDTGIAPENPSFAGDPLITTVSDTIPYLDGNDVVFNKGDGTQFRAPRSMSIDGWSSDAYTTKLVGAQYFSDGAGATGYDFGADYLSPRDADGHGSHTASTAAGNFAVPATVGTLDMGMISGIAPGAKISSYKACYSGPDESVSDDDICATSDLVAAIDAATRDGVDVINFSIGGGAATTTYDILDDAFLKAATAGVFVAVSAGNSGPSPATADHASPWYTTVAASTIPTYEGTVQLTPSGFIAPGAALTFPGQHDGPVVYAGDIPAVGADAANAALCLPGTLNAVGALGKIVVCDRGSNARVEKSDVVAAAGGTGMILVNVTEGSLDTDQHAVPTVHIAHTYRTALLEGVRTAGAEATLLPENITDIVTPVPQVAGFSSRGPMLADGSDILKPDVTAPGVNILAAIHSTRGDNEAQFGLKSGTSMSSPQVAGLAAIYLGERPNASPSEVKSALMTTAYNSVNDDGTDNTDPFAQGAGHVDPTKFFNPGLVYLNGPVDWEAFLVGLGYLDGTDGIDASNLNLASIAIGTLVGPQTVTRTVTATTAGTYTATAEIPGVDVTVEPASLTLAAGESATFTVTFLNVDAPVETWATGFLTWNSGDIDVRSPLAVYPTTADAPAELFGEGVEGTVDYTVVPGFTGEMDLNITGLTAFERQELEGGLIDGHTGDENSGAATGGENGFLYTIDEGVKVTRFALDSSDDVGSDLDLSVYRVVGPDDLRYYEMWQSATASADEQVTLADPTPGYYMVIVDVYQTSGPTYWDLDIASVNGVGVGDLTATPNPVTAVQGEPAPIALSWQGLSNDTTYLGNVQYGGEDSVVNSIVTIDAGPAAPVNVALPTLSGSGVVGEVLTANAGTWDQEGLTFAYEWLKNGAPLATGGAATDAVPPTAGASNTYTPVAGDVGAMISVRVYATAADNPNVTSAVTNEILVTAAEAGSDAGSEGGSDADAGGSSDASGSADAGGTADAAASASGAAADASGSSDGTLPGTGGSDGTSALLIGFLIAGLGGAAVLIARRRQATSITE